MPAHTKSLGGFRYTVGLDLSGPIAAAQAAAQSAVSQLGQHIKAESNAIAPLRDGTMIANSRVEVEGTKATIGYLNTVYAAYQHEETGLRHPNGRQARYLQSVMESPATAQAARDLFAQALRERLGG